MSSRGDMGGIGRRVPWSFIGCVIGLFFGAFGIYAIFFYEKRPDLRFEILSSAPIFTVKEDVNELQVMFEGKNLRESRQTLSLLALRLVNRGNLELKTGDFDPNDPLTIRINNGRLIRSNPLQASDEYFVTKVFNRIKSAPDTLTFPTFIMEPGEFLNMKLLILHKEDTVPSLETQGKIAKLGIVPIIESGKGSGTDERRTSALGGHFNIQAIRVLTYGFGTLLFVGLFIGMLLFLRANVIEPSMQRKRMRIRRECIRNRREDLLADFPTDMQKKLRFLLDAVIRDPSNLFRIGHMLSFAPYDESRKDELLRILSEIFSDSPLAISELYAPMSDENFLRVIRQFLDRLDDVY